MSASPSGTESSLPSLPPSLLTARRPALLPPLLTSPGRIARLAAALGEVDGVVRRGRGGKAQEGLRQQAAAALEDVEGVGPQRDVRERLLQEDSLRGRGPAEEGGAACRRCLVVRDGRCDADPS